MGAEAGRAGGLCRGSDVEQGTGVLGWLHLLCAAAFSWELFLLLLQPPG